MRTVPTAVYTRLVRDVVSLLVRPALDGVQVIEGGFEPLPDAFPPSRIEGGAQNQTDLGRGAERDGHGVGERAQSRDCDRHDAELAVS